MHSSDSAYNLPPFPAFPSIKRFIGLGSVQDAVDRIELSLQARDAISVVIGPPGTGKTLISELLASRHQKSHRVISLGETPLPDSDSFLRRFLHQAGVDLTSTPAGDLQLALFDHICLCEPPAPRILLLIDEAQALSPEILETIRTLTNLKRDGEPRVSVVMFGGTHLDELLIAPSMDGFRQRISTRCYLHPLNSEETGWYINQTIRNCGCDPDATITAEAISAVHHACSGVPRLINQLLSHAIDFAAEKNEYLITDRIIDQSWAEVQQLPSPMVDEPEMQLTESTVEFGELDSFDTPTDIHETTDGHTPNPLDDDLLDHELFSETAAPESDAYDECDFEPDSHWETSTEQQDSPEIKPSPTLEPSPTDELYTEVWDTAHEETAHEETAHEETAHEETAHEENAHEENAHEENAHEEITHEETTHEFEFQDPLQKPGHNERTAPQKNAAPEQHLDIDQISSQQLQYPELASPALEIDDELISDNLNNELSEEHPNTKTNEMLFGSFDEEEQIDLHAAPTKSDATTNHPTASIEAVIPQEIALHQEMIGISDLINLTPADKIEYCDDAHQTPNKMHYDVSGQSADNISIDPAHPELDESALECASLELASARHGSPDHDHAAPAPTEINQSMSDQEQEPADHRLTSGPQEQAFKLRHDDSDMLIIEDEVNIHRIDKRHNPIDASHQSIDYQRMLKRMRSKN